jgi:uncharacterized protein
MADRQLLPGKFVWYEHVSNDVEKAEAFYGALLGWKVGAFPVGDSTYDMILSGDTMDTMIGGFVPVKSELHRSHWISYVSVEDVDGAVRMATALGGRVVEAPSDVPELGRQARIADPQGAQLCLFTNANGDPPDPPTAVGSTPFSSYKRWFWNELHTPDPNKALTFYEKTIGYSCRSMDMGPAGMYYVLVSRDGVDRGGVTSHLSRAPHWLQYVAVQDTNAIMAQARQLGAMIVQDAMDIPGVGRFGVLQDPAGAMLAVMQPRPMGRQDAGSRSDDHVTAAGKV